MEPGISATSPTSTCMACNWCICTECCSFNSCLFFGRSLSGRIQIRSTGPYQATCSSHQREYRLSYCWEYVGCVCGGGQRSRPTSLGNSIRRDDCEFPSGVQLASTHVIRQRGHMSFSIEQPASYSSGCRLLYLFRSSADTLSSTFHFERWCIGPSFAFLS